MVLEECGGVCEPSHGVAPGRQGERNRPSPQGVLLSLGPVMMVVGGFLTFLTLQGPGLWMGLLMAVTGATLTIAGLCILMTTLQVSDVPGHFLLHPRTGTRYSPHQALAIQRRLDRIRREMSEDSVQVPPSLPLPLPPSLPLPLPPTPPPWDLEAPPSYDSVMKSRGPSDL